MLLAENWLAGPQKQRSKSPVFRASLTVTLCYIVGVGADNVKAVLYTLCRPCVTRMSSVKSEDEAGLVSRKSQDNMSIIKQMAKGSQLVIVCQYDQAEYYLKEGRPLIRIGKTKIRVIFP